LQGTPLTHGASTALAIINRVSQMPKPAEDGKGLSGSVMTGRHEQ
jgi:hypothetical protein